MPRIRVPRFIFRGHVVRKTAVYEEDLGLEKKVLILLLRIGPSSFATKNQVRVPGH